MRFVFEFMTDPASAAECVDDARPSTRAALLQLVKRASIRRAS